MPTQELTECNFDLRYSNECVSGILHFTNMQIVKITFNYLQIIIR